MNTGLLLELAGQARRQGVCGDWCGGPGLGAVLVSGADSAAYLQAQLTSDALSLGPGQGQLAARLQRTGKLRSWFSIHRLPDRGQPFASYLIIVPRAEIAELVVDLMTYVISEDVVAEDASLDFSGWVEQGVAGATDDTAVAEYSLLISADSEGELWRIRRSFTGDPGWLCLRPGRAGTRPLPTDVDPVLLDELDNEMAVTLWGWLVAEAGWPRLGADLDSGARILPQTGLAQHVVSFSKGCYLGQEVVARVRTYGSVPEALRAVIWGGVEPEDLIVLPSAGSDFCDPEGNRYGTWGGSYWSPVWQRAFSLVFLDRDHRAPGQEVNASTDDGAIAGEVAMLPLHSAASAADQAAARYDQALAHFSAGRDDQAVTLLEESLRLDPTRTEVFEALGVILGRQEKYHQAIDIFRRLEEVAPDEPMVHTNLSLFYMQIGDKDEAERQKSLGTRKRFGVGIDAAKAAAMAEQEDQARQTEATRKRLMFAEVLEVDPADPLALMGMGQALEVLGDLTPAAEFLQRALQVDQDNSVVYAGLGRVLARLERTSEAREVFQKGIVVASRRGDLMPLRDMEDRKSVV